jgi:ribosome-associated toxin RatA of RatAB toxin-antitoxin module
MRDIEVSRVIQAAPETLYDIVSDLTRMGELSPENTGGMWLDGATEATVGAKFRGTNSNEEKNKHWATTAVIEQADRGRVLSFRVVVGPVKIARWAYRFETTEGGTEVTLSWHDMRNWVSKKFGYVASGVADRAERNRENMEITLTNLARAARATGASGR